MLTTPNSLPELPDFRMVETMLRNYAASEEGTPRGEFTVPAIIEQAQKLTAWNTRVAPHQEAQEGLTETERKALGRAEADRASSTGRKKMRISSADFDSITAALSRVLRRNSVPKFPLSPYDSFPVPNTRAALASPDTAGWQLVPVEPTKAMFDAGVKAAHDGDGMSAKKFYPTVYKAMLSAAPQPPKEAI